MFAFVWAVTCQWAVVLREQNIWPNILNNLPEVNDKLWESSVTLYAIENEQEKLLRNWHSKNITDIPFIFSAYKLY